MKQIKIIQSILFCTFLFGSTIQSEINDSQSPSLSAAEQAQLAELAEFAEDALTKSFACLQKIENKLTEIALLVKKGLASNLASKPNHIMHVLTENKMTINALLQNQAIIIAIKDPIKHLEIAFVLSEFCNAFIPYLTNQIESNFKNAKPFDLDRFLKNLHKGKNRNNMDHLEPKALMKGLNVTNARLAALELTVQNIGLTWYNKVARVVDSYVVTPANKYHLPTIAGYASGVALLSLYSIWQYGNYIKKNEHTPDSLKNLINYLNDLIGAPIARNRAGNAKLPKTDTNTNKIAQLMNQDNADKYDKPKKEDPFDDDLPETARIIPTIDFAVKDFMLQNQPLGALAATYMLASGIKAWQESIYPKIIKRRDYIWNFLRGGEYLKTVKPGLTEIKPTVSFRDMVGLEEVKEAFYSIIQYIDNPEQLMRIEATPEKGWLLTGPTRTGKSFSVECLCGEIELMMEKRGQSNKMKFFNISAALVNEYGIKAILDEVRENAPAVIFIDEIDLLGLQRVGNNKLLSDFLTSMQSSMNSDPSKVVIIIAATNNPENIDKALRQNGRFGKEIRFEYPARRYRIQYIIRELTNMALNIKEFDPEVIADKTNGKSFEDLKAIIRNAMTRSWMNGTSLTQQLLEESIDTEIHHIITFNRKDLPENELRIVAAHFAGRALAAMNLETHEQLDKVTIHARMTDLKEEGVWENYSKKDEKDLQKKIEYGAFITKQSHDSINAKKESIIINEATILIAGFAAEELMLGSCGFSCHRNDRDRAYKMIEELVFGGLTQETLPKAVREELKIKAYSILKQCSESAMNILKTHQEALSALINELLAKRMLDDKQIEAIINKAENKAIETTDSSTPAIETQEIVVPVETNEEASSFTKATADTTADKPEEITAEEPSAEVVA